MNRAIMSPISLSGSNNVVENIIEKTQIRTGDLMQY